MGTLRSETVDERDPLVEIAYLAYRQAKRGGPLAPGEHEALRSHIEVDWMRPVVKAIEAAVREQVAAEIDREWARVKALHTAGGTSQRVLEAMDAGYYAAADIARGCAA